MSGAPDDAHIAGEQDALAPVDAVASIVKCTPAMLQNIGFLTRADHSLTVQETGW